MICRHDKTSQVISVGYDRGGKPLIRVPRALPLSAGEQFGLGWMTGETIQLREQNVRRLLSLAAAYTEIWCAERKISLPAIGLSRSDRYWGRCSRERNLIMLNPDLSRMPDDTVYEVILHELCHMIYHDHSEAFWRLMTREMPDWPEKEGILRCLGKKIRAEKRRSSRTAIPS